MNDLKINEAALVRFPRVRLRRSSVGRRARHEPRCTSAACYVYEMFAMSMLYFAMNCYELLCICYECYEKHSIMRSKSD